MAGKILLLVEDLLFLSKILETGRRTSVPLETVDPAALMDRIAREPPRAIILDLNHRSGQALPILIAIKASKEARNLPVIGFVSHVQTELARAARQAGCDQVLARSTFSQRLPEILQDFVTSTNSS